MSTPTVAFTVLMLLALGTMACADGAVQPPTAPSPPTVAFVVIAPGSATLDAGASTRFTADVRDNAGTPLPSSPVSWTSSAEGVARVAGDGTVTGVAAGRALITASAGGRSAAADVVVRDVIDVDTTPLARFVTSDYIDLSTIERISRFRSGFGHDNSDSAESCRSMKHYFSPRGNLPGPAVTVYAPVDGTIVDVRPEQTFAMQVRIRPAALAAATVVLFHVVPDAGVTSGLAVTSGARIGHHFGPATASDVAISVDTPGGLRLVSYFDAITDTVFERYRARGATSRSEFIISRAERDAQPLSCAGEQFLGEGSLPNWVWLR